MSRRRPPSLGWLWLAVFVSFLAMIALSIYLHSPTP